MYIVCQHCGRKDAWISYWLQSHIFICSCFYNVLLKYNSSCVNWSKTSLLAVRWFMCM